MTLDDDTNNFNVNIKLSDFGVSAYKEKKEGLGGTTHYTPNE